MTEYRAQPIQSEIKTNQYPPLPDQKESKWEKFIPTWTTVVLVLAVIYLCMLAHIFHINQYF